MYTPQGYKPNLSIPSWRDFLVQVHKDLFRIQDFATTYSMHLDQELSTLERLVLALEDRRFLSHHGIDLKSVMRETLKALSFRKHGGASTIDMQFVRTATGYKERTVKRKLYEMLLSFLIQFRYSKLTIIRSYLNCAFFGSGILGVKAAAKKLYNKDPTDLSEDEAAIIASMLVYPRPISPSSNWFVKVNRRADYGKRIYIADKKSLK